MKNLNMVIKRDPALLYLDIMKKALSFSLWEEAGIPKKHLITKEASLRDYLFVLYPVS